MTRYVATFHTHFAALCSYRRLTAAGFPSKLAPVPRALSSSCGTCVFFAADTPRPDLMHRDLEQIAAILPDGSYKAAVVC